MNETCNVLEPTSSIKVIIYTENKSSFFPAIINQKWVPIIEVISRDGKKGLTYIMFK